MPFPTHLTFIDIETTAVAGPDAGTDAIIEVAAAIVDLKTRETVKEWSTLVRPPRFDEPGGSPHVSFPTWVLGDFHAGRYDGVDWSSGLTIDHSLQVLEHVYLTKGVTVAGQKPGFDLRYLRRDWERIARDDSSWPAWPALDYHEVDLVSPAFLLAMTGAIPGCSLRHTAPLAGCGPQKHRALDDVRATIAVFWMLADIVAEGHRSLSAEAAAQRAEDLAALERELL